MMKNGLIVEDLAENRLWLSQTLQQSFADMAIHCTTSLAEARHWLATSPPPDMALIDLGLPDGSGIELIELLNQRAPATLCVVATIYDDDNHLFAALRAGAQGYILKDQGRDEAARLLQGIAAGQPPLSSSIARRILGSFRAEPPQPLPERPTLTPREHEVLRLISKGMTLTGNRPAAATEPPHRRWLRQGDLPQAQCLLPRRGGTDRPQLRAGVGPLSHLLWRVSPVFTGMR
jgi:DNA-binding NarL/FixJ family response regulator